MQIRESVVFMDYDIEEWRSHKLGIFSAKLLTHSEECNYSGKKTALVGHEVHLPFHYYRLKVLSRH